jgi:N-formylglutamate deformylase
MKDVAPVFSLHRGRTALLVSLPHCGTRMPEAMLARLVPAARSLDDTDWHLEEIYGFVRDLGASLIVPRYSRYLIDLNRPPDGTPMYPGANNTDLVPGRSFEGEALYPPGGQPDEAEVAHRRATYWQPYHDALQQELARLKALHGYTLLFDGHSIKSELPWLFSGRLPDLNLGSADGATCAPQLRAALLRVLEEQSAFSSVADGRFKGGYITRHYGRPAERVHAVQLEMCWSCYMIEAPPYRTDPLRYARLVPVLRSLVQRLLEWRPPDD